ncbi:hypothetical protein MTO96_006630 [Rhipicephalus appendiculatus]
MTTQLEAKLTTQEPDPAENWFDRRCVVARLVMVVRWPRDPRRRMQIRGEESTQRVRGCSAAGGNTTALPRLKRPSRDATAFRHRAKACSSTAQRKTTPACRRADPTVDRRSRRSTPARFS